MPDRLRRAVAMPWRDLVRSCLRVCGTSGFLAMVTLARSVRLLPRAYDPARDVPSFLVVALTPHLGDAVMLTPMLQALKAAHPDTPVDLAVEYSVVPLLNHMPELRTVYGLRLGSTPPVHTAATVLRVAAVLREYQRSMRGCRPAVCILPRWGDDLFRSAYLAVLSGAPRRVGFASSVGWPLYRLAPYRDRLLTEVVVGGAGLHEPERFLDLLRLAGLISEGVNSEAVSPAMLRLANGVPWRPLATRLTLPIGTDFAVIAPGASQPQKMWPLEHWCEVIRELAQAGLYTVLLSGKSDSGTAQELQQRSDVATTLVAGVTSLQESAALLQHAALFLGSDSGPAHLAGALGTPTIVLFTASAAAGGDDPFSPRRNRPMGPYVRVLQPQTSVAPCVDTCKAQEAHCIRQITPADVAVQIRALCQERVLL